MMIAFQINGKETEYAGAPLLKRKARRQPGAEVPETGLDARNDFSFVLLW